MFSVKRFDAFSSSSPSGSKDDRADTAKLDALNERISKKRKVVQSGEASGLQPSLPGASSTSIRPTATAAGPAAPAARPALNIHPSRLNNAPLLRQSVKKAQTGPREKTKAKQRYLKAKKDRRKARLRAAPKKSKADADGAQATADNSIVSQLPEEEALHRREAARKKEARPSQQPIASEIDSMSSADSDTESSEESSSDSDKEDAESASPSTPEATAPEVATDTEVMDVDGEAPTEEKALERFPLAGIKKAVDPTLIRSLGLPEGLSNRTVVDPTLSRPLPQQNGKKPKSVKPSSLQSLDGGALIDQDTEEVLSDDQESVTISARSNASDDFSKVSLSDAVRSRLEALGVSEWFAVQVSVIPCLLAQPQSRSLYRPFAPPRDLCVSAPTGSGKTLAYSVPIVEVLRARQIVRLRALIVLPTRDLVFQVRTTLELVAKGSGLRIGTATGQHSFAHEQTQLVGSSSAGIEDEDSQPLESKVDILIATPGRLIDHLDSTPGFTLAHLRFLVIDEADRLLNQSFQEWLGRVLAATNGDTDSMQAPTSQTTAQAPYELLSSSASGLGAAASATLQEEASPSVQKLLFSATLTRDPAKIAALGLRNPHYITVQDSHSAGDERNERRDGAQQHERFSLPHSLHEHMLVTTSAEKPFHLLYLLHRPDDVNNELKPVRKALCFTKSVDSAARLVKLFDICEAVRSENSLVARGSRPLVFKNYSSELKPSDRQRILTSFEQGEIDLLICSDLISRGIDLPSVEHVISYDAPIDPAKYVHRVGRTARAGKHGDAWTLVEEQEARHFKKMVRSIARQTPIAKIKPKELKEDEIVDFVEGDPVIRELHKLREAYEEALGRMAKLYRTQ
ncbi:hypothetical protein PHSY_006619 [Pseudozyma hubeiensis SY62]|uniref:ATP-dependent RNA helicase n=1 Tax=Pseudozyma hubeiensis (strain SY62) TaxID=1305764 RepID=R9PCQ2_PSEHS|nr:hypothetical protein PHSY_006619 [Pseudozyma hubeiensis SY62]GAC99022.1 hypothetical protein PHSY_006619 [Pseudozyma hubeiensis SY62]